MTICTVATSEGSPSIHPSLVPLCGLCNVMCLRGCMCNHVSEAIRFLMICLSQTRTSFEWGEKNRNKWSDLQTFSSVCPCCHGSACPRLQSQRCSPSPCPGGHLLRRSCGGRQLAPGSGKRATGSEGGPRCTHRAQAHLRPPCHPPNATAPLEDSIWEEEGQMVRLGNRREGNNEKKEKGKRTVVH